MYKKYDRTNFIYKDSNNDGVLEWDMILSNWDLFTPTRPLTFDTVQQSDIQRPDILSFRIYGVVEYWWILCKFNQIDDVWNDMYVGMDLIVPDPEDIKEYYANVRRRIRK